MPLYELDYLRQYAIDSPVGTTRRNVALRRPGRHDVVEEPLEYATNRFCWKLANRLEGRDELVDDGGIWPIHHFRCERRFGHPPVSVFSRESIDDATPEVYAIARQLRILCYARVTTSQEAMALLASGGAFRYGCEITSDWYDPPEGRVTIAVENPEIIDSHGVEVFEFAEGRFHFNNWWSSAWGDEGKGSITPEYFDRFIIEAWQSCGFGMLPAIQVDGGIVCLEWKYSPNAATGIHGREIVEAATGEHLAWAFARPRQGYLDVEEFYVWPSERRKGYGRKLADMIRALAESMNRPLRLLVSFADTEPNNLENLEVAANLLGVQIQESSERWVHAIGMAGAERAPITRRRPNRPGIMLERLRPIDEAPIDAPIEYEVFYGTNRQLEDGAFTAERGDCLHLGKATVTIPRSHRFGSVGRRFIRFWNWIIDNNPHLAETRVYENEEALAADLSTFVAALDDLGHNILFVHGFNVGFDAAVLQAAQFGVDLKVHGATFCYSWPSAGQIHRYIADEAAIEASIPYLSEFIQIILRNTGEMPLSIIVHSMGNRAVLRYLSSLVANANAFGRGRIGQVMLAAPDVDAEVFIRESEHFLQVPQRTTLYATNADVALLVAGWLHNFNRAGLAPPVMTLPGMESVFVEGFSLIDLGHGYIAETSAMMHDMFSLLHYDAEPRKRAALIRAETHLGYEFWRLPIR